MSHNCNPVVLESPDPYFSERVAAPDFHPSISYSTSRDHRN